ncbi:dTDP-4-dehydrorhamnose 3,5-epimerase [Pseudoxanthobacter soli DSM 19599]|uniref:dTDP-4-dehydrorhamnose 3,5-epimerase n=1 Tax=Pseudoxanthobacter soli DSM 19599 TaxID=1123029 RepID=A0A1M7ZQ35_9HYPH|nr:dTDP-4-dehydrorhamnose 3,5-epimerase [Pseudoxanthobacter soli]SHO66929.1 dTDP-4-dehydrorhamnose 3,5-epimerase [Pseudoxanthobacter soli DSM 19599]
MDVREFEIPGVKLVIPKRFGDHRGFFSETWSDRAFRQQVADIGFVQDNHSLSAQKGTLRGLHFQKPPSAQGKLVRVVRGAVFDVAVDIRHGSPTFGRHVSVVLDAREGAQLWIPPGFLHGFCTLEDDTEFLYKVTGYYSAADDAGVAWDDPDLGIDWPVDEATAVLSDKDRKHPRLRDLPPIFAYEA